MSGRRTITAAMVKRIFIAQANEQRGVIPCAICGEPLTDARDLELEHLHALSLGGPDTEDDMRFVHKATCAALKTNGTKATSYGSDKHAKAKLDRLTGKTCTGPKRRIPQRRDHEWPSRPFPKRRVEA